MSNALKRDKQKASKLSAVSFTKKYTSSETFMALFREGMELIEETSDYLEGDGRMQSRALSEQISLIYSTESMRLTTQLMQLASWLVIYRGIAEGKLTPQDVEEKRRKIKFNAVARPEHIENFTDLPIKLRELIEDTARLYEQIVNLDRNLLSTGFDTDTPRQNPLSNQMAALEAAFGATRQ